MRILLIYWPFPEKWPSILNIAITDLQNRPNKIVIVDSNRKEIRNHPRFDKKKKSASSNINYHKFESRPNLSRLNYKAGLCCPLEPCFKNKRDRVENTRTKKVIRQTTSINFNDPRYGRICQSRIHVFLDSNPSLLLALL